MGYKATVNGDLDFSIAIEDLSNLDIIKKSNSIYHILSDYKSVTVEILESHFFQKTYTVSINNKAYKVSIENDLDQLITSMGFEKGSKKQINLIKAPMPGLVLEISVTVGQQVAENETLLILEAMKMENSITSPVSGIIKSIEVEKGDAVEKNQLLIEFE